jgi:hypothetical protein
MQFKDYYLGATTSSFCNACKQHHQERGNHQ